MAMTKECSKYHLVDDSDDDIEQHQRLPKSSSSSHRPRAVLALLILSLLANAGLLFNKYMSTFRRPEQISEYAQLANDIPKPFIHTTEYSSGNLTQVQELWDAISFDAGQISIPHDVAAEMQLPPAQPFPWDTTRGIYLVSAYHNLHCLKSIQKTLMEYHLKIPITYDIHHSMHCLDALREDTICHADDTPRYTTNTTEPVSGIGQNRQCRDWTKMERWVEQFESCWRYLDESADRRPQLQRYLFCAEDSPYYARMENWAKRHPEIRAPHLED